MSNYTQARPEGATHFDGTGHLKYNSRLNLIMKNHGKGWVNHGRGTLKASQSLEVLDRKIPADKDLRSFETLTTYG